MHWKRQALAKFYQFVSMRMQTNLIRRPPTLSIYTSEYNYNYLVTIVRNAWPDFALFILPNSFSLAGNHNQDPGREAKAILECTSSAVSTSSYTLLLHVKLNLYTTI